jgi:hypothetical protein
MVSLEFVKNLLDLKGCYNITTAEFFGEVRMPGLGDYVNISAAATILKIHPGTVKRLYRERK